MLQSHVLLSMPDSLESRSRVQGIIIVTVVSILHLALTGCSTARKSSVAGATDPLLSFRGHWSYRSTLLSAPPESIDTVGLADAISPLGGVIVLTTIPSDPGTGRANVRVICRSRSTTGYVLWSLSEQPSCPATGEWDARLRRFWFMWTDATDGKVGALRGTEIRVESPERIMLLECTLLAPPELLRDFATSAHFREAVRNISVNAAGTLDPALMVIATEMVRDK